MLCVFPIVICRQKKGKQRKFLFDLMLKCVTSSQKSTLWVRGERRKNANLKQHVHHHEGITSVQIMATCLIRLINYNIIIWTMNFLCYCNHNNMILQKVVWGYTKIVNCTPKHLTSHHYWKWTNFLELSRITVIELRTGVSTNVSHLIFACDDIIILSI